MPFTPAPTVLESAIRSLKKELDAVILAHYYQESEIQDVADFIGDSLALAQEAARTQAKVIVFCGVHFMAETAKILNPTRQVLLPDLAAGCSLADRTPPAAFAAFKAKHPGAFVVTYVNSSAEVKAMSDVICTSSNAVKMVEKAPKDRPIIFAPDQHLGRWVQKQTGRELVLWPGSCNECPYMKLNTMEKLWRCMADRSPELVMLESLRLAAYKPLKRMLDWS